MIVKLLVGNFIVPHGFQSYTEGQFDSNKNSEEFSFCGGHLVTCKSNAWTKTA